MDGAEVALCFVGAGVGGILRFVVAAYGKRSPISGANIPYWTLAVNVVGSFIFGLVFALTADKKARAALTAGFCGGLTTFSSFSAETLEMLINGGANIGWAILNVVLNVVVSTAACLAGRKLGEQSPSPAPSVETRALIA